MKTWFTADTHFGHGAIIEHCARPFPSVGEMDRTLVANWNAVVGPKDDVWHLGDFCMGQPETAESYIRRLRGRIHLIHGNHDRPAVTKSPLWASSQAFALVKVEGVQIALLHYGMRVWPGSGRGTLHLYGHSHGNLPGNRQCVDVGVDYPDWGMRPVGLPEIQAHLATLPERGRCQD